MAALDLRCCVQSFSSCGEQGLLLFVAMYELLIAVASLDVEHRLQARGLSSCGTRAYLLCVMWKLPEPGIEPVSPALAGRLLPTVPPGKSSKLLFSNIRIPKRKRFYKFPKRKRQVAHKRSEIGHFRLMFGQLNISLST